MAIAEKDGAETGASRRGVFEFTMIALTHVGSSISSPLILSRRSEKYRSKTGEL